MTLRMPDLSFEIQNPEELLADVIEVPKTTLKKFEEIQKLFSPPRLTAECMITDRTGNHNGHIPYIKSRDPQALGFDYVKNLQSICLDESNKKRSLSKINSRERVGIVIGNGNIFSFLAIIPADTILLLDIDVTVLFYILSVKEIILQTKESKKFNVTKAEIQNAIANLETLIFTKNNIALDFVSPFSKHAFNDFKKPKYLIRYYNNGLKYKAVPYQNEESQLGDLYFLKNQQQFSRLKAALLNKTLITIQGDIFDYRFMHQLGIKLQCAKIEVAFLNASTVLDCGNKDQGATNFALLPLANDCRSIFASTRGYPVVAMCKTRWEIKDLFKLDVPKKLTIPSSSTSVYKTNALVTNFSKWSLYREVIDLISYRNDRVYLRIMAEVVQKLRENNFKAAKDTAYKLWLTPPIFSTILAVLFATNVRKDEIKTVLKFLAFSDSIEEVLKKIKGYYALNNPMTHPTLIMPAQI